VKTARCPENRKKVGAEVALLEIDGLAGHAIRRYHDEPRVVRIEGPVVEGDELVRKRVEDEVHAEEVSSRQQTEQAQVSRISDVPGVHDPVPLRLPGHVIHSVAGSHGHPDDGGELQSSVNEQPEDSGGEDPPEAAAFENEACSAQLHRCTALKRVEETILPAGRKIHTPGRTDRAPRQV